MQTNTNEGNIGGCAYAMAIRQIRAEEYAPAHKDGAEDPEAPNWTRRQMVHQEASLPPAKRYLNSASISVLCRRMMATEWTRAMGRTVCDQHAPRSRREREAIRGRGAS